ncbi:MAG: ubiquinol-cytochrome C reductase, partial [Pontimonas sp.]
MAVKASGTADGSHEHEYEPGSAVVPSDGVSNPGLPPERPRVTDLDEKYEKQAERRIAMFFGLSIVGSIIAAVSYSAFPITPGDILSTRINNLTIGLGITIGLLGIGFGAVHWAKSLMHGHELVEERHQTRGDEETRQIAADVFTQANKESGFTRRSLVRNTMIGALLATPIPAVALFRDLAPEEDPNVVLKHTMWEKGMRLTRDPS